MHTVCSSAGSSHYKEQLPRHLAESHSTEDSRQERRDRGYVHFRPESNVPDVGGLGWRTRAGHLLKNQAYYSCKPKTNKWDLPLHAGLNTWKEWHGPKMRTDAAMMERMDQWEEENDEKEAKKTWVNTVRAQTLDRFYNQKLNRDQLEASRSWAPHRRARREVHDCHENFFADMDAKPEKVLKILLTDQVLQRDREAIRQIAKRIQNEETWKLAWKHMEQERRQDIRHDFRQRQNYNTLLMELSGQPSRSLSADESSELRVNSCSQRTEEMAEPRDTPRFDDVTSLTDFRGLFHADNEHALEALFPGFGHDLSVEFRNRATASAKAGFPPPSPPETPRLSHSGSRDEAIRKNATLTTEKKQIAQQRLEGVATRVHDETLSRHSKAQFLNTAAPPPPQQSKQLLKEDFTPKTTLQDPGRVTGSFERTDHCYLTHGPYSESSPKRKAMESLPPAQRSYVYPVLTAASPVAKGAQASGQVSETSSPITSFHATTSQANWRRSVTSLTSTVSRKRRAKGPADTTSAAVCRELDAFEASAPTLPRVTESRQLLRNPAIANFFGTPRSNRINQQRGEGKRSLSEPSLLVMSPTS
jgi:hypothetical protein